MIIVIFTCFVLLACSQTSIQDYGHSEYRMPGLRKTAAMAEQLTNENQLLANYSNEAFE